MTARGMSRVPACLAVCLAPAHQLPDAPPPELDPPPNEPPEEEDAAVTIGITKGVTL